MAESACWIWVGAVNSSGYGVRGIDGQTLYVHRLMYEAVYGLIPEGLQIDHLCRNRRCYRPDHLEAVTQQENIRRGAAVITHCPKGHPYEASNLRVSKAGSRQCRTCHRDRMRLAYQRKIGALMSGVEGRVPYMKPTVYAALDPYAVTVDRWTHRCQLGNRSSFECAACEREAEAAERADTDVSQRTDLQ